MDETTKSSTTQKAVIAPAPDRERRKGRRVKISKPLRIRPEDPQYREEVRATLNASRDGLYFTTWARHYYIGMRVCVTFPYASHDVCNAEYFGEVARIERLSDGRLGIAVRILLR